MSNKKETVFNRSDLNVYYEAGKYYGEGIIKEYSKRLTSEIGSATLEAKEAEQFRTIKSLEVQMYESGGPMLPKNPRRAKEILNEYNNTHKDKKIKIEKVMWGK